MIRHFIFFNKKTNNFISRAAVKRLKTLRHPSVLTYVHSVETDKSVLLATEPVEPLQEHLEQLVDRGPKRDNYIAWGIFQVSISEIQTSYYTRIN